MTHWHRARVCALLAGCLLAAGARAGDRVVLMVGGIDKQIYLPARLAQRLGYFADEGVDVELRSDEAGVNARDQLLLGTVDGVIGFYDHTIDLQAKGKFVESVVQFARAPGEALLGSTRPSAAPATLADLRGVPVGVT
ncbi:MAG TPA: ABC transporter substrate-binding protein, partial [Burkholderiaceae bacterium]